MTTFAYTSGDPSHLLAGTNATMADMQGPLIDLRTFLNGNITDINLSSSAAVSEAKLATGSNGLAKGAFYCFYTTANSFGTGATTTLLFDTDLFDVSGWLDTATNKGRFTPQVPGYYRFSWYARAAAAVAVDTVWESRLRKNGSDYALGQPGYQRGAAIPVGSGGSATAIANGTTDFFEVGMFHNEGVSRNPGTGQNAAYFTGELIGRS